MEFFRCDGSDCGYVTEDENLEKCPHCGGEMFVPVEEDYVSGYGWMCLSEQAEEKGDNEKALAYVRRAMEEEYPHAIYHMGLCYLRGRLGLPQDKEKAVEYFQRVGDMDDPAGWCALGQLYQQGEGVEQDFDKAVELFEKAAEADYAPGVCALGLCWECGEGKEQSWEKATELYRQAADMGYARAQCNLGWCYEFGKGVEQSMTEAVYWYSMAAEQEDPRALCNLGLCYERGEGVEEQSWENDNKIYRDDA